MNSIHLGNIYFIKDGKFFLEEAFLNEENMRKQSFNGLNKSLKLYSDKELDSGSQEISKIYSKCLNNNITIVRAFHRAMGNLGEVTLLDEYDLDIYIPLKPSMKDINVLRDILSNYDENFGTITNLRNQDYDYYSYIYNYSYNKRKLWKICELFYKEKNLILDDDLREMFSKYREFSMSSLVLDDYNKYTLNNRNTGIVVMMQDLVIKKTVTKEKHKKECIDILNRFYQVNNDPSYIDLVSEYGLVIGFVSKDIICAYVSFDINDYQLDELSSFVKEVYDIKSLKEDLITSVNVIRNREVVFDGQLAEVKDWFANNKIK